MLHRLTLAVALLAGVAGGTGRPLHAQTDPRTALLERAGWEALNAGRLRAAAEAFSQALATDARNPRLHLGAGTAAFVERRDEDARAALSRALALDPKLTRARELLGLVLYRRGELDAAVREYETLVAASPEAKSTSETLARWRREVEVRDRMTLAIGAGFTLSFEGPPEAEIATRVSASVELAIGRVAQVLSTYPAEPLRVVLYTSDQFRDITRAPQWAAGAYDGTIRIPVRDALASERELDRVIAHEVTHAFVTSLAARGVPTWLNEGLATALERDEASEATESGERSEMPRLGSLEAPFGRLSGSQVQRAYATSALAARRLLEDAGGAAVANLLRDLGAGVDFDKAFFRHVHRPFADFEASLNQK